MAFTNFWNIYIVCRGVIMPMGFDIHAHVATLSLQECGTVLCTWGLSLLAGFHWQKTLYLRKHFCWIRVLRAAVLRNALALPGTAPSHLYMGLKHVATFHWKGSLSAHKNHQQCPDHWAAPHSPWADFPLPLEYAVVIYDCAWKESSNYVFPSPLCTSGWSLKISHVSSQ